MLLLPYCFCIFCTELPHAHTAQFHRSFLAVRFWCDDKRGQMAAPFWEHLDRHGKWVPEIPTEGGCPSVALLIVQFTIRDLASWPQFDSFDGRPQGDFGKPALGCLYYKIGPGLPEDRQPVDDDKRN